MGGELSRRGEADAGHLHLLVVALLTFGGEEGDGVSVRIGKGKGGGSEDQVEKAHFELSVTTSYIIVSNRHRASPGLGKAARTFQTPRAKAMTRSSC